MPWIYYPHSGGTKIPPKIHEDICKEVESFSRTRPWYPEIQLVVRFKNQFCYIDTVEKKNEEERIFPLCRLRYLNANWSLALFTWSNERYEPCAFLTGKLEGSIEEALVLCDASVN